VRDSQRVGACVYEEKFCLAKEVGYRNFSLPSYSHSKCTTPKSNQFPRGRLGAALYWLFNVIVYVASGYTFGGGIDIRTLSSFRSMMT
jgi:hypothetical protein